MQISMLAMIYFIFFQVNILTYVGLVHVQNFFEIIKRLATVFEMEEQQPQRITSIEPEEVMIEARNCAFSWGFRVKENQEQQNKQGYVDIEEVSKPIVSNVNFNLKFNDILVIVGAVGSGKTTLLHSIMEETKICEGYLKI